MIYHDTSYGRGTRHFVELVTPLLEDLLRIPATPKKTDFEQAESSWQVQPDE